MGKFLNSVQPLYEFWKYLDFTIDLRYRGLNRSVFFCLDWSMDYAYWIKYDTYSIKFL